MGRPKLHKFKLPLFVRQALRSRKELWVSEWARKNKRWVETPSRSGYWNAEKNPLANGVLDALGYPSVNEVCYLTVPQVGKSEIGLTALAWMLDQEPMPFMYILQTDKDARDMGLNRLKPMMEKTSWLRRHVHFTGRESWSELLPIKTCWGWMTSGQSINNLASKPAAFLIIDEEEKYPRDFATRGEATPVRLAYRRVESFIKYIILRICTPTDDSGTITIAYLDFEIRFLWLSVCPFCGTELFMKPENLLTDDENVKNPDLVDSQNLGFYRCQHCGEHWNDYDRDRAQQNGRWVVGNAPWANLAEVPEEIEGMELREYLQKYRPKRVAFWSWRAQRTGQRMSKIVSKRIKSKLDKDILHDFLNGDLAQPWRDMSTIREADQLKPLRVKEELGGIPTGLVPSGKQVACLMAAIDVQKDWVKYEIRAFGFGLSRPSWGIRCGVLDFDTNAHEPFQEIEKVLWGIEYKDSEGNEYPIALTLIDSGYHTAEVYDWARKNRGRVRAIKGGRANLQNPFSATRIERMPPDRHGRRAPLIGGLDLWVLNVAHYKDQLAGILGRTPEDLGAWKFAHDYPDSWLNELCGEHKNSKGEWVRRAGFRNEAWDISVYLLAAEDMLKVRLWSPKNQLTAGALAHKPEGQRYKTNKKGNPYTRGSRGGNPFMRRRR